MSCSFWSVLFHTLSSHMYVISFRPSSLVASFPPASFLIFLAVLSCSNYLLSVLQYDPRGKIPAAVVNSLNLRMPLAIARVRKHFKAETWDKRALRKVSVSAGVFMHAIACDEQPV